MVAGLAVCMHFYFVVALVKWILSGYLNIRIPRIDYGTIKIVGLGILGSAFYWFNSKKRTQKIMDKLVTDKDPTSRINAIKVIGIIFVPTILIIILAQKSS